MDFQESALSGNQSVIDKFGNFLTRLQNEANGAGWSDLQAVLNQVQEAFEKGMDDDLNTSIALAAVFDFMTNVNKNFEKLSREDADKVIKVMKKFDTVLAVFPESKQQSLTPEQEALIQRRQEARLAKDWATADNLKKQLLDQGVEVKDTPTGPVWKII